MTLFAALAGGAFPALSDSDAVRLIGLSFEPELEWLKNATPTIESSDNIPVGALCKNWRMTPSRVLYGVDYPELNRSLVSMLAVKWLLSGDYQTFTCCQIPSTKLKPESFQQLRSLLAESCPDSESIYALLVAIAINDLGKNEDLTRRIENITGKTFQNHDEVVYAAAAEHLLPSVEEMEPSLRSDLLLGLELGSRLNIAQFAQAECVIASLEGIAIMRGRGRAFALKFLEVLLDVSGAGGHINACCATQMTEPAFRMYLTTRRILVNVIGERMAPKEAYDCLLLSRKEMLEDAGFRRGLSIHDPADRALLRLLTMGRVVEKDRANYFVRAFEDLGQELRQNVIAVLDPDGADGRAPILLTYAPALISEALKNTEGTQQALVLSALLRLLARIHESEKAHLRHRHQQGSIKEVNLSFAQEVVKSDAFRKDPDILDDLSLPDSV